MLVQNIATMKDVFVELLQNIHSKWQYESRLYKMTHNKFLFHWIKHLEAMQWHGILLILFIDVAFLELTECDNDNAQYTLSMSISIPSNNACSAQPNMEHGVP